MSPRELEQCSSTPPHLQPLRVCKLEDMLIRFDKIYRLLNGVCSRNSLGSVFT